MQFSTKIILFLSIYFIVLASRIAEGALETTYATQTGEELTIGNNLIEIAYHWNDGDISSSYILNKNTQEKLLLESEHPDFGPKIANRTSMTGSFQTQLIPATPQSSAHLEARVQSDYGNLSILRKFRIYEDSPLIGCDYFVKVKTRSNWDPKNAILHQMMPNGKHWEFSAVEFHDKTDKVNNLLSSRNILSYFAPTYLRGNLLLGRNLLTNFGLIVLKEAPSSTSQHDYPGYDFIVDYTEGLKIAGIGFGEDDLIEGQWTRAFGTAIGVSGPEKMSQLSALRAYQKNIRPLHSSRSDRIVMNTWGDRNGDTSINEAFIESQIDACARLGIDVLQIDDGWQAALSRNTKFNREGKQVYWDSWPPESWVPHPDKFPKGFDHIVSYAREKDVLLGLWFHPSNHNDYENWQDDAQAIARLFKDYGIRYFKIDGIKLPTKAAETNLRKLLSEALRLTDNEAFFNLDLTADIRGGYHYLYDFGGNLFLENRYTEGDKRYYPHKTLRNLWDLSAYVPPESLQVEFLNTFRNRDKYDSGDPFAPKNYSFEYQFAITMPAQALAWFEAAGLPDEGFELSKTIETYKEHREAFHTGTILPIGNRPNGRSWTGFQSIGPNNSGYLLVFREWNQNPSQRLSTHLPPNSTINLEFILGDGPEVTEITTDSEAVTSFKLQKPYSFALYHYSL